MPRIVAPLCRVARESFENRRLQMLLLMVIASAFVFAVVFDADASIVIGVLVTGGIAALKEAAEK